MKSMIMLLIFVVSNVVMAAKNEFHGTLDFAQRITFGLSVSGSIKTVDVRAGQFIKAGQQLIQLDPLPFRVAITQAEAQLVLETTNQREQLRDYEQAQALYDRAVLSTVELENAELKLQRSKAMLSQAQANLELANYHFQQSQIVAPFDGWVVDLYAHVGQHIINRLAAQPLIAIGSAHEYVVRAQLSASALASLKHGQQVKVKVGKKQFPGNIQSIALTPINNHKTKTPLYEVLVVFTSNKTSLRVGQSASVEI